MDTQRVEVLAPGVSHRFVYAGAGPWAVHVLDVNLAACYRAVAVKGVDAAAGRRKTSALLAALDSTGVVVGGVNADFFTPNGTPTNAHISRGQVVTGPSARPVLAFDSLGRPSIATFRVSAEAPAAGSEPVRGWNRPLANGVSWFDQRWGGSTDTASGAVEVVVRRDGGALRFAALDTLTRGVTIPAGGGVLVFRGAAAARGEAYEALVARQATARMMPRLEPFHPREAVGGRPRLLRDSAIVPDIDTDGGAGFAASRHPRTAAGIASGGRRLLLVTVDGRQKPYSDGMTLRELATLMLSLGARDAVNLDGGGSTTMVIRPRGAAGLAVANRPSDATGERAVGNALAIVRGCGRR